MIIQVEGVDGSGKSSLVKHLGEFFDKLNDGLDQPFNYNLEAEKLIPTKPGAPRIDSIQLHEVLDAMAEDDTTVFVLDRGPFSDIIYRLFDDYMPVTTIGTLAKRFDKWTKQNKGIVIYCTTRKAEENMLKRGDDNEVSIKNHKLLSKIYDMLFVQSLIPCWYYNIESDSDYEFVDAYVKLCLSQVLRNRSLKLNHEEESND